MTKENLLPNLEIAQTNPSEYRRQMFNCLAVERSGVYRAWTVLRDAGFVEDENVLLDTKTYQGDRSGSSITIGLLPIPEDRRKRIFQNENFTEDDVILYKFTHELSHRLVDMLIGDRATFAEVPKSLVNVLSTFKQIRDSGYGFTNRQVLDNENKMIPGDVVKKRAEEDLVDYITMYLWDEQYLEGYLKYLSDPNFSSLRRNEKQMTMSPQLIEYLSRIKELVSSRLS